MCSAFIARLLAGSVEWDEREKRKNEKGTKEILIDGETGKFMNLFVDWLFGFRGTRQKVFAGNKTTISKTYSTAPRQTLRSTKLFSPFVLSLSLTKFFFVVFVVCAARRKGSYSNHIATEWATQTTRRQPKSERINIMQQYMSFAILIYHHKTIPVARTEDPRKREN